eukprot:21252-Heterococcus_DN1.PRE.6
MYSIQPPSPCPSAGWCPSDRSDGERQGSSASMGWTAPPDAERSEPGVPGPSLQSRNLAIFPRLRGTTSHFVTAFHAAPTSCLTLPQAKSLVNAAYYAGQHEGRLQVRVDDAGSPQSCSMAFENALLEDLETLGIVPDQ